MDFKLRDTIVVLLIIVLLVAVMVTSIVVAYQEQRLEVDMQSSYKEPIKIPELPQTTGSITQNSIETLTLGERNIINSRVLKDPLVLSLIEKAGGYKNIGAGIVITDDNGSKVGGCSGVQLADTIWTKVKYRSIFGGEMETVEGLIDYVIACVNLNDGSIIGYMIQTKSIMVTDPSSVSKNIDEKARSKIMIAIEKAKEHVALEYGMAPEKYRVVGVEDGILYVIAYLGSKYNNSDIYNVETIVIKFDYNNMNIIDSYRDMMIVVNTSNIK